MPRLWILLVIVWYRAITLAKTQTTDQFLIHPLKNGVGNANEVEELSNKPNLSEDTHDDEKLQNEQFWKLMRDEQATVSRKKRNQGDVLDRGTSNDGNKNPRFDRSLNDKSNSNENISVNKNINVEDIVPDAAVNKNIFEDSNDEENMIFEEENLENKMEYLVDSCVSLAVNKRTFNSWGGKRNLQNKDFDDILENCMQFVYQNMPEGDNSFNNIDDKQTNYNSWAGKRNTEVDSIPKRLPFRAWGGKRGKDKSQMAPKRIPFRPWGGKRSPEETYLTLYSDPRKPILDNMAILSLTGNYPRANEKRINRKKTKFHSWGGKRSFDDQNVPEEGFLFNARSTRQVNEMDQKSTSQDGSGMGQRRLKFNSWGGKRSPIDYDESEIYDMYPEGKRTFNSWGGKRGLSTRSFNAWGGKRTSYDDYPILEGYKRTFNSWGGK